MVFSSIPFLFLFLPLTLLFYFLVPSVRVKNAILLLFSLLFYAWGEGELVLLMVLSSLFNYGVGIWINRSSEKGVALAIGVSVNVLALIYFKYVGFLAETIDSIVGTNLNNGIDIHLPIGISFFTFQAISYIVDVYRGNASVQRNPFDVMLYISLFPQLVAGPIVRYTTVADDLVNRKHTLYDFVAGSKRFTIGLAKKLLVANVMGEIADELFSLPYTEQYFATAWFAILAYSLQIFFDFSGYSDMAIGLGRMFGFRFPENFLYPYVSRSIREFWRRWHITLSSWFRDYLYIPMGGSRVGNARTNFNLFVVFVVTGLWHGATWNFLIWGLLHGAFIMLERTGWINRLLAQPILSRVYLLLVVLFTWVLFRLPDFPTALEHYAAMFRQLPESNGLRLSDMLNREYISTFFLGVLLSVPIIPKLRERLNSGGQGILINLHPWLSFVFHVALLYLCMMYVASSTYNPFIYFRF